MRVISGKFKGKRLFAPSGDNVRPTTDRIKESIFNILANKCSFIDADVLDLFCGSGALGIESLSRGAKSAVFIDNNPNSISLAKQNLLQMKGVEILVSSKNIPGNDKNHSEHSNNSHYIHSNNIKKQEEDVCFAQLFNTDFKIAIKKLSSKNFNIIFIDPPYFENLGENAINLIVKYDILAQNGIIVYEHYGKNGLSTDLERFIIDERSFGSVSVAFLTKA